MLVVELLMDEFNEDYIDAINDVLHYLLAFLTDWYQLRARESNIGKQLQQVKDRAIEVDDINKCDNGIC